GADTRAIYRRAESAARPADATFFRADLAEPVQAEAALAGASSLFLLTGNEPGFLQVQLTVVDAARRRAIRHIVKLSALGASDHSRSGIGRDHWAVEQAAELTKVTGRAIAYRPISMEDARVRLTRLGQPTELIDATLAIAAYQRDGGPTAMVSPTVQRVLGRPPRTIGDFARDYAAAFS